jgi:hypothetical protein
MKTYCYHEYSEETNYNVVTEKTENEILGDYWNHWYARMITKYGEDDELITEQNCIYDWCVTHGAWEKKNA